MSIKLTLTKNGLKAKSWNGEKKGKHRFKKKADGSCSVVLRDTGLEVFSAKSIEAAEEMFWETEDISGRSIIGFLKDDIKVDEGVTLYDVYELINSDDSLKAFVDANYKNHELYKHQGKGETILLSKKISYDSKEAKLSQLIPIKYDINSPIVLDDDMQLSATDKTLDKIYSNNWNLFEILFCLFNSEEERNYTELKKDFLYDAAGTQIYNPFEHLMDYCELDSVALLDLFQFVGRNEDIKEFIARYSSCSHIDDFHKAINNTPKKKRSDLWRLEISHGSIDADDGYIGVNGCDFSGIGEATKEDLKYHEENKTKPPDSQCYAIELTPVENMAHLPIKLDDAFKIYDGCKAPYFKYNFIVDSHKRFTLLDILDAVYWEISFFGGPQDAEGMLKELNERMEDVKNNKENLISFEDMQKELKEDNEFLEE